MQLVRFSQGFCRVFIGSQDAQLIDLICFPQISGDDLVPSGHTSTKQSHAGHDPSVMIECGIEDEGFKGFIHSCGRPEGHHNTNIFIYIKYTQRINKTSEIIATLTEATLYV